MVLVEQLGRYWFKSLRRHVEDLLLIVRRRSLIQQYGVPYVLSQEGCFQQVQLFSEPKLAFEVEHA